MLAWQNMMTVIEIKGQNVEQYKGVQYNPGCRGVRMQ